MDSALVQEYNNSSSSAISLCKVMAACLHGHSPPWLFQPCLKAQTHHWTNTWFSTGLRWKGYLESEAPVHMETRNVRTRQMLILFPLHSLECEENCSTHSGSTEQKQQQQSHEWDQQCCVVYKAWAKTTGKIGPKLVLKEICMETVLHKSWELTKEFNYPLSFEKEIQLSF